jgi:hypothetical protein
MSSVTEPAKALRVLKKANPKIPVFDVRLFLDSAGLGRKVAKFRGKETVFTQGDPAKQVMYIQEGGAKLTVVNESGKAAVVAILGPGDFLGEGCLAGRCAPSPRQIDEQRVKPNEWEENVANDQMEYIAGKRGQRKVIQLSPADAQPTIKTNPIDVRLQEINKRLQEIELVTKPAPQPVVERLTLRAVFQAILRKVWLWAVKP